MTTGTLHAGSGAPLAGLGAVGDHYRNTTNQDLWYRDGAGWQLVGNVLDGVPDGVGTIWLQGSGTPWPANGSVGNYYRNTDNQDVWYKSGSGWLMLFRFSSATPGSSGVQEVNGQSGPTVNLTAADVGADPAGTAAAAISALVGGAGPALDTLNELAAALGNDPNFATTMATALANRLRVDAAQALTTIQQAQALSNLGLSIQTGQGTDPSRTASLFEDFIGPPFLSSSTTASPSPVMLYTNGSMTATKPQEPDPEWQNLIGKDQTSGVVLIGSSATSSGNYFGLSFNRSGAGSVGFINNPWRLGDVQQAVARLAWLTPQPDIANDLRLEFCLGYPHSGNMWAADPFADVSPTSPVDQGHLAVRVNKDSTYLQFISGYGTSQELTVTDVPYTPYRFYTFRLVVAEDGSCLLYVDGALKATHSGLGKMVSGAEVTPGVSVRNMAVVATALRQFVIDAFGYQYTFANPRLGLDFLPMT